MDFVWFATDNHENLINVPSKVREQPIKISIRILQEEMGSPTLSQQSGRILIASHGC